MSLKTVRRTVGVLLLLVLAWVAWLLMGVKRQPVMEIDAASGASGAGLPEAARPEQQTGCSENFALDWRNGPFRKLEAKRGCLQPDQSLVVETARFVLSDESGLPLIVEADRGVVPPGDTSPVQLSGNVKVKRDDGFWINLAAVELDRAKNRFTSSTPVEFGTKDLSGTAGSIEHDWKTHVTILTRDPVVKVAGDTAAGQEITARGQRMILAEDEHVVRLREGSRIDYARGSVIGASIDVLLSDAGNEVRRVDASGDAETLTTASTAALGETRPMERRLRAARIVHEFGDRSRLKSVEGEGGAVLAGMPAGGGTSSELLSGDWVRLDFQPGLESHLESVRARGAPARLSVANEKARRDVASSTIEIRLAPGGSIRHFVAKGSAALRDVSGPVARALDADLIEAAFRAGGESEIESLHFEGSPARATSREPGMGGALIDRKLVARKGDLDFGEGTRAVSGRLEGDVFVEGPQGRASGDSAEREAVTGRTTLRGGATLITSGREVHGDLAVHDAAARTLTMSGRQHTIVHEALRLGIPGGLASGSEPTYISSDRVIVHLDTRHAIYTGGRPSLRRGDNEIMADSLDIQDATAGGSGTLDAEGKVESRLRLAAPDASANAAAAPRVFDPMRIIRGTSSALHWRGAERKVRYTGGVHLEQESSTLSADEVDVRLKVAGGEVESVLATGTALFRSSEGEAEGDEIRYVTESQNVLVSGHRRPASARGPKGQFGTGAQLEMNLRTGDIHQQGQALSRARGSAPLSAGPAMATGPAAPTPILLPRSPASP